MQVKRFFGVDAKSVIKKIRDTLGEEAMILSNRQLEDGIEILCGIEENNIVDDIYQPEIHLQSQLANNTRNLANEIPKNRTEDTSFGEVRRELHSLRGLIEDQLSEFVWKELQVNKPVYAVLIKRLLQTGFPLSVSKKIAMQTEEFNDIEMGWRDVQQKMAKMVPCNSIDILNTSEIIAVIGQSSVGKTSSLIKLAARYSLIHASNEIVIISTDTSRVGANDSLKIYSKILGISLRFLEPNQSLNSLLNQLNYAKLILIDTPSASTHRLPILEELKEAKLSGFMIKKLLVISALQQLKSLNNFYEQFRNYHLDGCIITHIDEAVSLGESLGLVIDKHLPICYISNGEQVPEDIHVPDITSLVKKCWDLSVLKENAMNKESIAIKLLTEAVQL